MKTDNALGTKNDAKSVGSSKLVRRLTSTERTAFELMEPGLWYDPLGYRAPSLPAVKVRRPTYVMQCLHKKGAIEEEIRQAVPGDLRSLYTVYCRPQPPNKELCGEQSESASANS